VDIDTAPRMRWALDAALAEADQVVVDLGAVTFLDSAGLSVLIATQRKADAAGVTLSLQHVGLSVLRLLDVTGMTSLFAITPS
jgi:anti-sigma B factor antagonist